jgi:hypothetical protein
VKRDLTPTISIVVFVALIMLLAGPMQHISAADYGPNVVPPKGIGFLFDESSTVMGNGHVSIRGSFGDRAAASNSWMKGTGSINLESLRGMKEIGPMLDFTQKTDLVFEGGQLKNRKLLSSPLFDEATGASVQERFNVSQVNKSEIDMIRSINWFDNTLIYNTTNALEGIWAIKTIRGSSRSDQTYSGSFDIQKNIFFADQAADSSEEMNVLR